METLSSIKIDKSHSSFQKIREKIEKNIKLARNIRKSRNKSFDNKELINNVK